MVLASAAVAAAVLSHLLADDSEVADQQLVVMSNLHQAGLAVAEVNTAVRTSLDTTHSSTTKPFWCATLGLDADDI